MARKISSYGAVRNHFMAIFLSKNVAFVPLLIVAFAEFFFMQNCHLRLSRLVWFYNDACILHLPKYRIDIAGVFLKRQKHILMNIFISKINFVNSWFENIEVTHPFCCLFQSCLLILGKRKILIITFCKTKKRKYKANWRG